MIPGINGQLLNGLFKRVYIPDLCVNSKSKSHNFIDFINVGSNLSGSYLLVFMYIDFNSHHYCHRPILYR